MEIGLRTLKQKRSTASDFGGFEFCIDILFIVNCDCTHHDSAVTTSVLVIKLVSCLCLGLTCESFVVGVDHLQELDRQRTTRRITLAEQ